MKANINGIQLEGTPDEIVKYVQKMNAKDQTLPYPNPYFVPNPYVPVYPGTADPVPWWMTKFTCGTSNNEIVSNN